MIGAGRRRLPVGPPGGSESSDAGEADQTQLHEEDIDTLEPWSDFMQRAAGEIEQRLDSLNIPDWIVEHKRKKFRFAGRLLSADHQKWSRAVFDWDPGKHRQVRDRAGRPARRWSDCFASFCESEFGAGVN